MLGWLVYSVGLVWSLIPSEKAANNQSADDPADRTYFPFYVVLIGGPAIYVFGALHAMLSGVASAVLGIFVTFLNVVYFSSVSWIAYDRGLNVSLTNSSTTPAVSSDANRQAWLMFEGTLFTLICWGIVLILALFYKNPGDRSTGLNPRRSQDCLTSCTRATHQTAGRKRPFPGGARLLSIPFLILSVIGWCLFVAGYHQWNSYTADHKNDPSIVIVFDDHTNPIVVCALIIGPLLYLASLLHAGCSGRANTMGVFTTVLHVLYVVSNGFIITHLIRLSISNDLLASNEHHYMDYMLGGCVASFLFWTVVYALRPFYQDFQGTLAHGVSMPSSSRVRENNLRESTPGSPPPDYGTATAATHAAQVREGDTQPLLAESAQ
jgi:hypothetical protein